VPFPSLSALERNLVACRACPRLVRWRERVAGEKRASFRAESYWGRPVPGFGDAAARILLVGLAPAAHGANRTGRMFTGDRSGDWLYRSLHAVGLAEQPTSVARDDGQRLRGAYLSAVVRCAPPANKPTPAERDRCLAYLVAELGLLARVRVVIALGAFAWDGTLRALAARGHANRPRPRFGHGAEARVGSYLLIGCYHPSQQNTFTGRLSRDMLESVLSRARELAA